MKYQFIASASELQSDPIFLHFSSVLLLADVPNLNNVMCTEAFIDEIVANQDRYAGIPLVVDLQNLLAGNYDKLGHAYNAITGTFRTTEIGSLQSFEKRDLGDGKTALVGHARVAKRLPKVCRKLGEMFTDGALKLSFEINAGLQVQDGKVIVIDAAEENYLEAMCVVSFPACPEAVAEQLVAELQSEDGDPAMPKKHETSECVVEVEAPAAAAEAVEAETPAAEVAEAPAVEVEAEAPATVGAEVEVIQTHVEVNQIETHDWENDEHVYDNVVHETKVRTTAEEDAAQLAELLDRMDEMSKQLAELAEFVKRTNEEREAEVAIAEITNSDIGEAALDSKLTAEIELPEETNVLREALEPTRKSVIDFSDML